MDTGAIIYVLEHKKERHSTAVAVLYSHGSNPRAPRNWPFGGGHYAMSMRGGGN